MLIERHGSGVLEWNVVKETHWNGHGKVSVFSEALQGGAGMAVLFMIRPKCKCK